MTLSRVHFLCAGGQSSREGSRGRLAVRSRASGAGQGSSNDHNRQESDGDRVGMEKRPCLGWDLILLPVSFRTPFSGFASLPPASLILPSNFLFSPIS